MWDIVVLTVIKDSKLDRSQKMKMLGGIYVFGSRDHRVSTATLACSHVLRL